jgi:hypothetical protein
MFLNLPEIILNGKTVIENVKVNAESLGRFRIIGTGITHDGDKKKFDVAVTNTTFHLEGLNPGIKSMGIIMNSKEEFTCTIKISLVTKDILVVFQTGKVKKTFNTQGCLEAINKLKEIVISI